CEIWDLLLAPPAEEAYKTPKETLIRWVTPSELQRLQRLLHEAQLLRHMQQLLGTTTAGLDSILLLMAVPPSAVSAMPAEPDTPDQLQEIQAEISHLTDTIAALRTSDSRSSSQGNTP
ncbi:hypothetical protein HPB47_015797, partial [Ixodes persulcatus]